MGEVENGEEDTGKNEDVEYLFYILERWNCDSKRMCMLMLGLV